MHPHKHTCAQTRVGDICLPNVVCCTILLPHKNRRVPAGAARINLVYVTDCLLSHAQRSKAPPAARGLPQMVGAGLARMLQLAVTDKDSSERVKRTLDAWGRKGLLEAGYLKLGYERLEEVTKAVEAAAATAAAAAAEAAAAPTRTSSARAAAAAAAQGSKPAVGGREQRQAARAQRRQVGVALRSLWQCRHRVVDLDGRQPCMLAWPLLLL